MPQETDAEKIARLERTIEQLQRESERLQQETSDCFGSWKRRCEP